MAAQTFNARQTAADVNAALGKRGIAKALDAKRVRAWVRDNVESFDDDSYTAHQYSAALHRTIVDGIVGRYTATGGKASAKSADQRGTAASSGRKARPAKPLAGSSTKGRAAQADLATPDATV